MSLDDIHESDLVFAVGLNPGTNMPRMLSALEECKRNGGHVIAVNPLPEAGLIRVKNPQKVRGIIGRGTVIADQFLHVKLGGDLALFQAINSLVLQAEVAASGTVVDHEFINAYTTVFIEFAEYAEQVAWPDVLEATGLSREAHGRLAPASKDLLSEVAIICRLARRTMGGTPAIAWEDFEADYDLIRDRISRVVPDFEKLVKEHRFPTPSGKAVFTCNTFDRVWAPHGHLVLETMRSHDQWNTVPYALNDRYRGIHNGRRVVLVNPADIGELGLVDRQLVDLVSMWADGIERRAKDFRVAYPAARGSAASYYPETNVLVPLDSVAEISNTPTSKGAFVRIEPVSGR